jgi:hypothetical protein
MMNTQQKLQLARWDSQLAVPTTVLNKARKVSLEDALKCGLSLESWTVAD